MSKMFQFDTPSESTGFLLWKVSNLWQRTIKRTLKKYDLTHTQFVILASTFWLSKEYPQLTQVEIANHIDIDKMMTSKVLRILVKKELIIRKEHPKDTRAKVIQITPKGTALLQKAVKEVEEFDIQFFSQINNLEGFNNGLLELLKK